MCDKHFDRLQHTNVTDLRRASVAMGAAAKGAAASHMWTVATLVPATMMFPARGRPRTVVCAFLTSDICILNVSIETQTVTCTDNLGKRLYHILCYQT